MTGVRAFERTALIRETVACHHPPLIAVNNLDDVQRQPTPLRLNHPAEVYPLPGAHGAAFVVSTPTLDSKFLWVATENERYRDDYFQFVRLEYPGTEAEVGGLHVDHLFNRARARAYALRFLRLALLEGAVNRSHGASYEKDLTTNEAGRRRRDLKYMDEIISMKYFGFLPPLRNDPRESEVSAYAAFAASSLGLDANEVRASIRCLRAKASKAWARERAG